MFARRLRLVAAAVIVVAATTALAVAQAAKAPKVLIGVQGVGTGTFTSSKAVTGQLNQLVKLHAKVIRVEAEWSDIEPLKQGTFNTASLAQVDQIVNGAAARGIKVVLVVDGTPCWASSAPADVRKGCAGTNPNVFAVTRYQPTDPTTYIGVSTFLAKRYGSKLAAYEVWNEPDQINEKYWAGPNKVVNYVRLVKAVYGPLKQANPQMKVLAGSFVGVNGKWLQAMYAAGVKGSYDGLAVHFYDLPLLGLTNTRKVQRHNGDSKPLWLTEFGWTSCYRKGSSNFNIDHKCVTAKIQAQNTIDLTRSLSKVSWVRAAIIYQLEDDRFYDFGLVDVHGRQKPVFTALTKVATGAKVKVLKPTMRIRLYHGKVVASGVASGTDSFTLTVKVNGLKRFIATLRTRPDDSWKQTLPPVLGKQGISATIAGGWTGRASARLR